LKKRKFLHVNSQNLLLGIFLIFRRWWILVYSWSWCRS
jgi:hypothetical protein